MALISTRTRTATAGNLNVLTNWTPNPGAFVTTDVLAWTSTSALSSAIGGAISVGAVQVTSVTGGAVAVNATGGSALTLSGVVDAAVPTDTYFIDHQGTNTFTNLAPTVLNGNGIIHSASSGVVLQGALTASGTITKTGTGYFYPSIIANPNFSSPIILKQGSIIGANNGTSSFGSGSITVADTAVGNAILNASNTSVLTVPNTININAPLTIGQTNQTTTITFNGPINFDTHRVVTTNGSNGVTNGIVVFNGQISAPDGFTKSGAGDLRIDTVSNNVKGFVKINQSTIYSGTWNVLAAATNIFPAIDEWQLNNGSRAIFHGSLPAYTMPPIRGYGGILITQASAATLAGNAVTLSDLTDFTGDVNLWGNENVNNRHSYINVKKFPTTGSPRFIFVHGAGNPVSGQQFILNIPSDATVGPTTAGFTFDCYSATSTNWTCAVNANQLVGAIDFQGVTTQPKSAANQNFVLVLGGTNQENNTISGAISNTGTSTLGIWKTGVSKWVLSNDNAHKGNTNVNAGTLSLTHVNALRESVLDWTQADSGSLSLNAGVTTYYVGSIIASTAGTRTLTIPANYTLQVGGATWLTSSIKHDYQTDIDGTGTLRKVGPHTIGVSRTLTLTGNVIVEGGVFESYPGTTYTYARSSVMFNNAASLTLNNAFCVDILTPASNVTTSIPSIQMNGSGTYWTGTYSASGGAEVYNTYTGTISGTGNLGIICYNQGFAGNRISSIRTNSLPDGYLYYSGNGLAGATRRGIYRWVGTTNSIYPTKINLYINDTTAAGSQTYLFSNDSPTNSSIELQGTIDKSRGITAGTIDAFLEVSSTGTGAIKFSGVIQDTDKTNNAGALGIWKQGLNTLTLSNANTYRGDTRPQTGTLRLDNSLALQNSGLDWTSGDTGTLDLTSAGLSSYTFGGLKSTTATNLRPLNIPTGLSLSVGNSFAIDHTFQALLVGDATVTLRKILANTQTFTTYASPNFLGPIIVDNGRLNLGRLSNPPLAFRIFDNVPSITVNNGGSVWDATTAAQTITYPVIVNAGGIYTGCTWSSLDTIEHNYVGGITGDGTYSIAASNLSAAGTYYARGKSTSLPSNLEIGTVSGAGSARYATYVYGGTAQSFPTAVRLTYNSAPVNTFGWSIQNAGTGTLTLTGNITKWDSNNAGTVAGKITLGSASDTQDIILTGSLQQGAGETGALSVDKSGPRRLTLAGSANTYTGGFTHLTGTTTLRHGTTLGAPTGTVATTFTAGTVEFDGNGADQTYTKTLSAFTLGSGSALTIKNIANNNTVKMASATLAGSVTFDVAASTDLTFEGAIGGVAGNTLTKTSSGILSLISTNGYLGPTVIRRGTIEVKKLSLVGTASGLGNPALAQATITMGQDGDAGIQHTGTAADSMDRSLSFQGVAGTTLSIDSSGTGAGAVTITAGGTLSFGAGTHTLNLIGSNPNVNVWARNIPDGGGATSLRKSGSNTWNVTAAPTFTGNTDVNVGTLRFNNQTLTLGGGLVMSGGTLENGTGVLTFTNTMVWGGGTISANVAGSNLQVDGNLGNTRLVPQAGGNPGLTGTATFNAGSSIRFETETITELGDGKVLGDLDVTVKNQGVLTTAAGYYQRGRARYGGDLTFEGGSILKIGAT